MTLIRGVVGPHFFYAKKEEAPRFKEKRATTGSCNDE